MQTILMKWNRRANEIVENDLNAYFVNVSNIFAENGLNILHDDYFHPNDKGYQLIAEAIFAQIKENEKAIFNVNQP